MTKQEIKLLDQMLSRVVKDKAKYICEKCGKQTTSVQPHHIFSRSKRSVRWDLDNIIVLCAGCHMLCNDSAHKNPIEFLEFLLDKRGKVWYNRLRKKARQIVKYQDYVELYQILEKNNDQENIR